MITDTHIYQTRFPYIKTSILLLSPLIIGLIGHFGITSYFIIYSILLLYICPSVSIITITSNTLRIYYPLNPFQNTHSYELKDIGKVVFNILEGPFSFKIYFKNNLNTPKHKTIYHMLSKKERKDMTKLLEENKIEAYSLPDESFLR